METERVIVELLRLVADLVGRVLAGDADATRRAEAILASLKTTRARATADSRARDKYGAR